MNNIGSHNSMSYMPVKQWYFKPLRWTFRCQDVSIHDQYYKYGVKLFDLRINFDKDYTPYFAHGMAKFKGNVYTTINQLNNFAKLNDDTIHIRIILECNRKTKRQNEQEECFKKFCEKIQKEYTNLIFFGGNRKYDWEKIYNFNVNDPSLDNKYSSTTELLGGKHGSLRAKLDDIYPRLYAKLKNKKNIKEGTTKDFLFIDFVNIQ